MRYGHAFHIQATQTALINGRCTVEERLARWLLMAHDRIDGNELFLTHEFLSIMLGVRRASITETLRMLADGDLIAIKRHDRDRRSGETAKTRRLRPGRARLEQDRCSMSGLALHHVFAHDLPKTPFRCAGTE